MADNMSPMVISLNSQDNSAVSNGFCQTKSLCCAPAVFPHSYHLKSFNPSSNDVLF